MPQTLTDTILDITDRGIDIIISSNTTADVVVIELD